MTLYKIIIIIGRSFCFSDIHENISHSSLKRDSELRLQRRKQGWFFPPPLKKHEWEQLWWTASAAIKVNCVSQCKQMNQSKAMETYWVKKHRQSQTYAESEPDVKCWQQPASLYGHWLRANYTQRTSGKRYLKTDSDEAEDPTGGQAPDPGWILCLWLYISSSR